MRIDGSVALWQDLYRQPFKGITTDSTALEGRFAIADEGFDVRTATASPDTSMRAILPRLDELRPTIEAADNPSHPLSDVVLQAPSTSRRSKPTAIPALGLTLEIQRA